LIIFPDLKIIFLNTIKLFLKLGFNNSNTRIIKIKVEKYIYGGRSYKYDKIICGGL